MSIGNITTGGVGKTPFVQTVCNWLVAAGRSPVIVSRGYKSAGGANDEALLLKENLPGIPQILNPDRVAAVNLMAKQGLGDVAVLDDGFQHQRLRRTVDLVLLDATDPFGGGHLLPAGFLREPISALERADAVVLTRSSMVTPQERDLIRRQVVTAAPNSLWAEIDFMPTSWSRFGFGTSPLETLRGKRVLAFCGIGNPNAFRKTLVELSVEVADVEPFPDHHWFSETDLERLSERARGLGVDALVATQKDAVKIPSSEIDGIPFYSLRIETLFQCGEHAMRHLVVDRVAEFGVG